MIDIKERKPYNEGKIKDVIMIRRDYNIAALTKNKKYYRNSAMVWEQENLNSKKNSQLKEW